MTTNAISAAKAHYVVQEHLASVASGEGFTGSVTEKGEEFLLSIQKGDSEPVTTRYAAAETDEAKVKSFVEAAVEATRQQTVEEDPEAEDADGGE